MSLSMNEVCEKKNPENSTALPLNHPPNCGPMIKSVDDLPSGKVVSLYWNV